MNQTELIRRAMYCATLGAIVAAFPLSQMSLAAGTSDTSTAQGARYDTGSAIVELKGDPLSTYVKTRPAPGKKVDFDSSTVKAYRAQLSKLRNDFKAWLRTYAPKARVTGEFDLSLNAVALDLNGESLATIAGAPMVMRAEYEGLYYKVQDPDLDLISAPQAWAQGGGPANAGEGIKVAIIDSGVDVEHPCFDDAAYPARTQLGDTRFTNNKVIVAKVFQMRARNLGYTAQAIDSHGTHVAGTVACNYDTPASVDGVSIPHGISGVAPRALLGNYNIFPAEVDNARSEDILNALEAAYTDGFDVANMSIGGGASGIQDLVTVAIDNLDLANMVIAVAAGNSGPGHYTVESPGSAARALTAGAATVGHLLGAPVSVGGTTVAGVVGDFERVSSDLTAPLAVVTEGPLNSATGLGVACSALTTNLTGQIALVSRGVCSFSTKIRNAQSAGAVAVLISNNIPGDGLVMGQDGTANQPTAPAYNVSLDDGLALKTYNGGSTTIGAALAYFITGNDDFMASFSSQGPTDVDFRVKPDVVAPGVNVLSSIPISYCGGSPCFAFFQGTSMATPHLAGSAAVVRQQHPGWSAARVRSAIVNTADQGVLKRTGSTAIETDVNIIGAGRENLLTAVNATVGIDPVSISFGAVPSGSGQSDSRQVSFVGTPGATFTLSISGGGGGVAYGLDTSSVTLGSDGTGTAQVTMQADKGAAGGDHRGMLRVSAGGVEVAHAVVYTYIK